MAHRIGLVSLILSLWVLLPAAAQEGEVERAYRAIPHRYTPFPNSQAKMTATEKRYLSANFTLVNEAVVARVQAMRSRQFQDYDNRAARILSQLKSQRPPRKLFKYHQLVVGAVEDQRAYFDAWSRQPRAKFNAADPLVQSASSKLKQAYGILQSQFPGQAKQVQEAFFDHLCALDFI